jgi:hypothetical protein
MKLGKEKIQKMLVIMKLKTAIIPTTFKNTKDKPSYSATFCPPPTLA